MARAVGLGAVTVFSTVVRLKIHPSVDTLQSGDCTRKQPRYVRVGRTKAERSRGELPVCQVRGQSCAAHETVRLPVASRPTRKKASLRTMGKTT